MNDANVENGMLRGQVAELLGCSKSHLLELEKRGALTPWRDESDHRRYHRAQVEALYRAHEEESHGGLHHWPPTAEHQGSVASDPYARQGPQSPPQAMMPIDQARLMPEVIKSLSAGLSAEEVVVRTGAHPALVEEAIGWLIRLREAETGLPPSQSWMASVALAFDGLISTVDELCEARSSQKARIKVISDKLDDLWVRVYRMDPNLDEMANAVREVKYGS